MLFVHKDHQCKGIAKKLYLQIENEARLQKQKKQQPTSVKLPKFFSKVKALMMLKSSKSF